MSSFEVIEVEQQFPGFHEVRLNVCDTIFISQCFGRVLPDDGIILVTVVDQIF